MGGMASTPQTRAAVRGVLMRYNEYSAAATGRCCVVCGALHGRVERRKKPCANKTNKQTNKQTNKRPYKQVESTNRPRGQPDKKQNNRPIIDARPKAALGQSANKQTKRGQTSERKPGVLTVYSRGTRGTLGGTPVRQTCVRVDVVDLVGEHLPRHL